MCIRQGQLVFEWFDECHSILELVANEVAGTPIDTIIKPPAADAAHIDAPQSANLQDGYHNSPY